MRTFLRIAFVSCVLVVGVSAHAFREWDQKNLPSNILDPYDSRLSLLPTSGSVSIKPWSDYYWPDHKGGVAWRWQLGDLSASRPHKYKSPTAGEIAKLTDSQLASLSPAEKYDILMGRFDYPLTSAERKRANPQSEKWNGLCHSVAVAATTFNEPSQKDLTVQVAGSSRTLTFYPSDTKALLALALSRPSLARLVSIGGRCELGPDSGGAECWDVNPGAFYIAVTNIVGLMQEGLIMDVDQTREVWNSVISSYSSRISPRAHVSQVAAAGTVRAFEVEMTVVHTIGSKPARTQIGARTKKQLYKFTLELNSKGEIIGGEWLSVARPDMVWVSPIRVEFSGFWSGLRYLASPL